jgi:hypothetical protein
MMAHEKKAWKKSWYDLTIHAPIEILFKLTILGV